jgi:hypothetical protein
MNLPRLNKLRPPRMTAMGWSVLTLVLAIALSTAMVGLALYRVTGQATEYSTQ